MRLRSKGAEVDVGVRRGSGREQPNPSPPKPTLGSRAPTHSVKVNPSVRTIQGSLKDEQPKVERRRSLLWDRSTPKPSDQNPAFALRHKRSVSAIPGLSGALNSTTRPSTRETSQGADAIKAEEGGERRKTGTGMLLRPRPGSVVVPQRASQVGVAPGPGSSVRTTKVESTGPAGLALGSHMKSSTVDKRLSKRRSMMYLGQGPGGALDKPIELKQSREVLLDETRASGEQVDVDSKRKETLNRLLGKDLAGVDGGKKDDTPTPVPTPLRSTSAGTVPSGLDTPVHRTRATASTTRTHERAGSTPVVPKSMRADTPTGSHKKRTSIGVRPMAEVGETAKPTITNRARTGVAKKAGDSSGLPEGSHGVQRRASKLNERSTTPTPSTTPNRRRQPPSTGTTPTKTPSRRDPFNRLRPALGGSSDSRTRKQSNESDIDFRMEQTSRIWLSQSGGVDKESPLLGKVGEPRVGGGIGGSGRMKRMKSQGSRMGVAGGDVFGKSLGMDSISAVKVKELEAELEALQRRYEQEQVERFENERKAGHKRQVIEAMNDVVRACEEELTSLQRDRDERSKQVGLFAKAWQIVVASV